MASVVRASEYGAVHPLVPWSRPARRSSPCGSPSAEEARCGPRARAAASLLGWMAVPATRTRPGLPRRDVHGLVAKEQPNSPRGGGVVHSRVVRVQDGLAALPHTTRSAVRREAFSSDARARVGQPGAM
eukprot:scaffold1167_cov418-Prasinococcus_capsulatus_cf.AAC.2